MAENAEVKKKPTSAEADRQMLRTTFCPSMGHLAVEDVSRQNVAALHDGLREKSYVVNRVLALVSEILKWGSARRIESLPPRREV